ncbi:hypothetical protein TNCV_3082561 [Trichonephila clavipes]|nr:hypothetical protein TNCV_3082561 [Trichonephila clavipes]
MVVKLVTKNTPTWLYRQDFAKFSLNRHYNALTACRCENLEQGWALSRLQSTGGPPIHFEVTAFYYQVQGTTKAKFILGRDFGNEMHRPRFLESLKTFCAVMSLPNPVEQNHDVINNKLSRVMKEVAEESMKMAAVEEVFFVTQQP